MAALNYALSGFRHPPDRAVCEMSAAAKTICVSSAVCLTALLWVLPLRAQTALDDAYHVIKSKTFVDLTHAFGPDTPVWSGFGQARMSPAVDPKTSAPYTIEKDGFRATYYEMVGQYGTHVDPPAHFAKDGMTMDKIPLEEMILPLVVFDATPYLAKDPNHVFSRKDLDVWEAQNGRVPSGAFAALRTDMSKDFEKDPEKFKRTPFPAWSLDAVKFLVEERGVIAIGHESMDTDATEKMKTETYLLNSGHYQIEIMANLDKVPTKGALIVVSWPKVKDGLGFPARAFAILP
ncbi:MAG: cyclase family protein [Methylocella sp.]